MSGNCIVNDQGLRMDGRKPNELRIFRCKMGIYPHADGSAYVEQGNTKVVVAVYGPHQCSHNRLSQRELYINCQYSMATFSTVEKKNKPRGDRKTREMTNQLKQTLKAGILTEVYPKSQIDVYVEVLQSDGGNFCAAVNATTLALIDAGVFLKEFICACTASLYKEIALKDISNHEEISGCPTLSVASLPSSDKIAFMEMSQKFHMDYLPRVIEQAIDGCKLILKMMKISVKDHLSRIDYSK